MRLSPREWENLCRRCGCCCFEKWRDSDGRIHHTTVPCEHLDIVTRLCRVYAKRTDIGVGCVQLTPDTVGRLDWLPETCAYREIAKNNSG